MEKKRTATRNNLNFTTGNIIQIHNTNDHFSSYMDLLVPIQLTLEYCRGAEEGDFLNILMLSPKETFFYRYDTGTSLNKFNTRSPHRHNFYELMIVLNGEVYQQIEGKDYLYTTGSCCLINRNIVHREKFIGEAKLLFIGLSIDFINQIFKEEQDYFLHNHYLKENFAFHFMEENIQTSEQKSYLDFFPSYQNQNSVEKLYLLSDLLLNQMLYPKLGSTYAVKNTICELFHYLDTESLFHITPVKLKTRSDYWLFSRISHLLEDTNGCLTRSDLEQLLNYSGNYLNTISKKYAGVSLYEYGLTFRLKKASQLLTTTNSSIASICLELGFSNRTHFYQLFEKEYGVTPGDFRSNKKHALGTSLTRR